MSVSQVMFMQAAAAFAHQFLAGADPHAFTAHNIVQSMLTHPAISRGLVEAFEARFDPDGHGRDRAQLDVLRRVRGQVAELSDEVERQTFRVIELFITNTLRTNYFLPDRFGLSFRMDPAILAHIPPAPGTVKDDPPYGFFFFYGAHFRGFHVRHREMARGGVRVVPTVSRENFEMESNRLFAEVTALARTQQHKNKDIPEGGSKAVILVGPQGDIDRAVKSVADSLLDIIVPGQDGPSLPQVVDYLGREEVIYLGPDEHITPSHIEWIVERARRRGFRWPSAFMSSKPSTGINHKRYGVTSLGVIVFAEEMLGMLGIDPKRDAFRVKLTGGPRGDVAGNAMLLLMRQYGTNARIVAVTDGHGAAFDPQGLDHGELEHLVREERGIAEFNPERLGAGGTVAGAGTPEGVRLRDTLHNTAEADLFIPAGGRPETINDGNWRQFLLPDGSPSARAVVEGANIFFSPQARTELERHGVLIAQGASANKTGVICSSYEVLAGLTLSDEEFLAVKDEYVAEVLDILRIRARSEARLMLREYRRCGAARPLTAITTELSREINALADGIAAELGQGGAVANDPLLRALVLEYCPPLLSARYEDRIFTRIPEEHLRALVAAYAASRIVYAEGLGWMSRVGARGGLVEAVRSYLRQEAVVAAYRAELRAAGLTHVRELLGILDATACKFLTERDMGIEAER
nr:NAD-glutamate dehydrogenase domain-containing protein [Desulfobaculum xiamenense]